MAKGTYLGCLYIHGWQPASAVAGLADQNATRTLLVFSSVKSHVLVPLSQTGYMEGTWLLTASLPWPPVKD